MSACERCGAPHAERCSATGEWLCLRHSLSYFEVLPDDPVQAFARDFDSHAPKPSTIPEDIFRLLTVDDLVLQPDPEWLIAGLVPAEGLSVIFGSPGSFKSFVALDFALCVATGRPWFGREVKTGYVVYVAAEGSGGLKRRMLAWSAARGCPLSDMGRMRFLPDAVNLLDDAQVQCARRTLASLPEGRASLVVVDTMARSMVGGDENAARDVGMFISAVDGLCAARMVVHHSGRDGRDERGSSALRGAADTMIKTDREGNSPRVSLICDKQKDAEPWPALMLRLERAVDSCVLSLVVEDVVPRDELRERVLAHVIEHGPVTQRGVERGVVGRATGIREALKGLERDGRIESTPDGFRVRPDAPDAPGRTPSTPSVNSEGRECVPNGGKGTTSPPIGTHLGGPSDTASQNARPGDADAVSGLVLLDAFHGAAEALGGDERDPEPEGTLDQLIDREGIDPLLQAFDAVEVEPSSFWHWNDEDGRLQQIVPGPGPDSVDAGSKGGGGRWLMVSDEAKHRDLYALGWRTVEETAELLNVTKSKVYGLRKTGELRPLVDVAKGTRPMFTVDEIDRFLGRPATFVAPPSPPKTTVECVDYRGHAAHHHPHPATGRPTCAVCHPPTPALAEGRTAEERDAIKTRRRQSMQAEADAVHEAVQQAPCECEEPTPSRVPSDRCGRCLGVLRRVA